jgi:hypothetical protein
MKASAGLVAPVVGWAIGMVAVFHRTLFSGLRFTPGGEGDARLIHYLLEHGWRWLSGHPLHASLWSPPILWPQPDMATYTDILLGFGPLYWPWRVLGAGPHLAFVFFVLLCWTLNMVAGYLLLKRCFSLPPVAATAGAFFFAFGSPRAANVLHPQLIPQFFIVMALFAVIRLLEGTDHRWRWSVILGASLALQFYSAWYPFLFFGFGLILASAAALLVPEARRTLWSALSRAWVPLVVSALVSAAVITPGVVKYSQAVTVVDPGEKLRLVTPTPLSLVMTGKEHVLYGWLQEDLRQRDAGPPHANGIGIVTTLVALSGLWIGRRRARVVWLVAGASLLAVVGISWFGTENLWTLAFRDVVPGAEAIRALPRILRFLLYPAAVGIGIATSRLVDRKRYLFVGCLAVICLVEQLHHPRTFDRIEVERRELAIAAAIPEECDAFYLTRRSTRRGKVHEDAMWASMAAGKPTLNSRMGHNPMSQRLRYAMSLKARTRTWVNENLIEWIEEHGLDPERVCWVEWGPRSERVRLLEIE